MLGDGKVSGLEAGEGFGPGIERGYFLLLG
jgi:hypothetical protein